MVIDQTATLTAVVVGILSTARATRLLVHDAFPPVNALRRWWFNQTVAKGRPGWAPLLTDEHGGSGCPWCLAPWLTAINLAWALLAEVHTGPPDPTLWAFTWWVLNGWLAASYVVSMIVVRDEPPE